MGAPRQELTFDYLKPEMEGYYENYRIDVPKHVFLNVE